MTALVSLQFRFQKSIKSLLLQLFPFSLTIIIIAIITIVFLILVLFIWIYFQFIFYDGFLRIVSLLFLYLFSFLLFGSYSKFIFVPFFFIYFLFLVIFPSFCASNEFIMYFICLSLFSVLSLLDHLNYRQNSSPFSLCCCISFIGRKLDNFQWQIQGGPGGLPPPPYFWTKLGPEGPKKKYSWRTQPLYLRVWITGPPPYLKVWIQHWFYTLFLSTIPYLSFNGPSYPEPHKGLRYTHFWLYFNAHITCWRRLDTSSSLPLSSIATNSTS